MIKPVNNISFKQMYVTPGAKFTCSQNEVLNDIEQKLGKKLNSNDYLAQPNKDDSVTLYHAYGIVKTGQGLDEKFSCGRMEKIGRYDKNCPFDIEEYRNKTKNDLLITLAGISVSLLVAGSLLIGRFQKTSPKQEVVKSTIENVAPVAKDTAKNIAKDTIKMFK